jgi:hypothetical protein
MQFVLIRPIDNSYYLLYKVHNVEQCGEISIMSFKNKRIVPAGLLSLIQAELLFFACILRIVSV